MSEATDPLSRDGLLTLLWSISTSGDTGAVDIIVAEFDRLHRTIEALAEEAAIGFE